MHLTIVIGVEFGVIADSDYQYSDFFLHWYEDTSAEEAWLGFSVRKKGRFFYFSRDYQVHGKGFNLENVTTIHALSFHALWRSLGVEEDHFWLELMSLSFSTVLPNPVISYTRNIYAYCHLEGKNGVYWWRPKVTGVRFPMVDVKIARVPEAPNCCRYTAAYSYSLLRNLQAAYHPLPLTCIGILRVFTILRNTIEGLMQPLINWTPHYMPPDLLQDKQDKLTSLEAHLVDGIENFLVLVQSQIDEAPL